MPLELAVNLMAELEEETVVLPTSHNRESDTDPLRPPSALTPVGRVDLAAQDISELLKVPLGQPTVLETVLSGQLLNPAHLPQKEFQLVWQHGCTHSWFDPLLESMTRFVH